LQLLRFYHLFSCHFSFCNFEDFIIFFPCPFLGDFPRAWSLLLEYIETGALCRNTEVSLAALKSFQEILQIHRDHKDRAGDGLDLPQTMLAAPAVEEIHR
jgi:hypothetical protein